MPTDTAEALAPHSDLARGVLIQGERLSFHDRAARALLPGVDVVPVISFPALAARLEAQPRQLGLMAIENSVAGALLTNYLLIAQHGLRILGEAYLRISHSLLAVPGSTIGDIRTVESHPMALAQCRAFFALNDHLRPVEAYDTAGSATRVAQLGDRATAALAPTWCAAPLGLEVLAKAVEDSPHNWTRFVLVRHANALPAAGLGRGHKTSIAFSVAHESGSLAKALQVLADAGSSLTKIQSLPIIDEPWRYRFFADFLTPFGKTSAAILALLAPHTQDLQHLGDYPEGLQTDPSS